MEEFTAPGQDSWSISLSKYLQDGDLDVGSNFNRNYNSQVRTKALLLERLATALGCSPSDRFDTPRVPSNAQIPSSLKPIVRYAAQWPQYLRDLADHISQPEASIAAYPAVTRHLQAMHVDGLQPDSKGMINALSLLSQSRSKLGQAGRLIAEANMQLIAFMVFWHSTVSFSSLRQRACILTPPCAAQYSHPSRAGRLFQGTCRVWAAQWNINISPRDHGSHNRDPQRRPISGAEACRGGGRTHIPSRIAEFYQLLALLH